MNVIDLKQEKTNQQLRLKSGLMLGYAAYGQPDGEPLTYCYCHGANGSRFEHPADEMRLVEQYTATLTQS